MGKYRKEIMKNGEDIIRNFEHGHSIITKL
jgi:hypothetical protein